MEISNTKSIINNPVSTINKNNLGKAIEEKVGENLGKDEFLKLLTVQLSHQDPLKPMSNTEFISQMAEFSALEQMKNVNTGVENLKGEFSKLANMNLVGKQVAFKDGEGEYKVGLVEKVSLGKQQKVTIDGRSIDIEKVTSIIDNTKQEKIKNYENNIKSKKAIKN